MFLYVPVPLTLTQIDVLVICTGNKFRTEFILKLFVFLRMYLTEGH